MSQEILNQDKEEIDLKKGKKKTRIESKVALSEDEMKKESKNGKNKFKKLKIFFVVCFILGTICCFIGLFMLYGPIDGFRTFLITSAEGSMRHKYIEYWFYDQNTIDYIMSKNDVIEVGENTNTSLYTFNNQDSDKNNLETPKKVTYKNEYERQVLENPDGADYKIIEISEKKFEGFLAVIYDPSRVHTVTTQYLGTKGEYLVNMAKRVKAEVAINGGGFVDPNFNSNRSYSFRCNTFKRKNYNFCKL